MQKLEEIRALAEEIAYKRTWIKKSFEKLMKRLLIALYVDENVIPSARVEYYREKITGDPWVPDQELCYYLIYNGQHITLEVDDLEDVYAGSRILYVVRTQVDPSEEDIEVEDEISIREIRIFLENFDKALARLQEKLKAQEQSHEEIVKKLQKILEAVASAE